MAVKVLQLVDRLGGGGVAQVALNTVLGLNRDVFEPLVCTTRTLPTLDHAAMLGDAGIELIELPRKSQFDIFAWRKLLRILPECTIIHSHDSTSNLYGRLWGELFKVPIIIAHDHLSADIKTRSASVGDKLLKNWSDRHIAISEANKAMMISYEGHQAENISLIYNGIDLARFQLGISKHCARTKIGLPQDKKVITMIANFTPAKNHTRLFQAIKLIETNFAGKICCFVVGEGPLEEQIKQSVTQIGVQDLVQFGGQRSDIPLVLRASDVLVLPSVSESLPITILEALAAGCPIVTTPVGGIPEILEGVAWPMVDPSDPQQIANAIVEVLNMPDEKRQQIVKKGRERVESTFSRQVYVSKIEELYTELLKAKQIDFS